jgi:rhodanese-related sulfurtransferase
MRKRRSPRLSVLAAFLVAVTGAAIGAAGLTAGTGCSRTQDRDAAATQDRAAVEVATVTVDELDHMLASGGCQAVDANGNETRRRMGVIPGAVLLTDADPASAAGAASSISQLPSNKAKSLVFYCANSACSASHEAARKAITAGYTHVKVLPEGIAGWVKAGKQTSSI